MNILAVGDCHGEVPDIEKEAKKADVILATGDICGDSTQMRDAMFKSIDLEKEWYDILGREKAREMVQESLDQGDRVLKHLNSFGKPVFLVPGNWDWIGDEEGWRFLEKNRFQMLIDKYSNIHNINYECVHDSNFSYIGYGPCSGPEVPQYDDEKPESGEEMKELRKDYSKKLEELGDLFEEADKPVVFLSHNVPNQTSLDEIQNPNSPADGRHYGSLVVKNLLEREQPVLSIAGHIHEGYGKEKVSGTFSINAGLESHVSVEINQDNIQNVVFHPDLEDYS